MRLCFNYHRPQRQSFMAETITLEKFYSSSLGQYALRWEQNQYDKLVSDCFGYNAVQLGATGIDFLKNNRIGLKVAAEPTLRRSHLLDQAILHDHDLSPKSHGLCLVVRYINNGGVQLFM